MDKTRMGKRVASLLLSLVMMLSLLPTAAYAAMADGVETQGAIVSENGTGVSDDSNSSGGSGDLRVEDSEGSGNTGDQKVGGSSGSGTADDTTGAEGGADPTDSVNGNDSADPQDDGDAVMPTAASVVSTSEELVAAIAAASDGDTITLGEGEFTTVGNTSPKKSLTFEGVGGKTVWIIGDLSKDAKGEGNGDCSFDGCDTITFKNMTLRVDNKNYRGFIRINNTVVENCTLEGRTAYWGYETAKFVGSTFMAPEGDYALWDYSTKDMSFDGCKFNISGKGVHVYVEAANADKDVTRTVAVNNCTVNSDKAGKAFLNIKNSTQAYDVTLSGTNTVTGLEADGTTGSALYQVETTEVTETTGKPVAVKAKADDGTVTTLYEVKETVEASVAEVNGAKYKSLQAAVDAAKSGATVTLLADTRENVTVSKNAIVLDLNGHTLNGGTENAKPALTVDNKKVTLKDSSEAQTGTIKREDTADTKTSHYVIDIQGKNGFMIVESGKVENNSGIPGVKGSSLIRLGNDSVSGWPTLTIKGGTFTQDNFIAIKVDRGTLHLLGGTVNSTNSFAIENWNNAYIKGGTVNGTVSTWVYSTGAAFSKLEISGGTVNGNVASVNYDNAADKQARVYVTGGTVTGTLGTYTYNNGLVAMDETAKATIEVTGGTFSKDPTQYVVEDSTISKNDDGTYGVAKTYLAKIGDTEYYTMDEAFHAVKAGETIVMLRDYTTNKVQNSGDESFTIDLGGHTWTANIVDTASAAFEINYSDVTLTVKNGKVVSSQLAGLIPSAMSGTITYNNSKLVFDGVEMTANGHSGIETNGSNTNDTVTLKNSTLNVPNGYGIYFPSSGTLTIDNSVINAKTMGVQVCSGSLNISGAGTAITVTGDGIAKTENDGAIEDGAAISIVNRAGYKGLSNIEVKDGKFKANGTNAAVKAYKWEDQTASAFDNSKNVVAISGGTFSSEVAKSLCADGYIPTKNTDGTYSVKEGQYVAEVNGAKYATLTEAIDAATNDQTVTLLADATEDVVISKSITLDLGGKTLTNTDGGAATISVKSGTVTVKNGNVIGGTSYYNIEAKKDANLTLTDVNATAGNTGSSMIDNWGTLTITSGTYTGGLDTVKNEPSAKLNITGGTFTLTKGNSDGFTGVVFNYGELTISGGEFIQSDKSAPYGQAQVIHTDKSGSAAPSTVITGGTFKNLCTKTTAWTVRATNAADGATKVSGGAFNKSVKDYYCAEGFIPTSTKDADGNYGVKEGQYVAAIGSKKYETLADAIKAAKSGKTVTLLADVADCGSLTISKNITLDGGGHTISGNSSISVNMPGNAAADVTIKNVNFKDIANGNKLSAFYFSQVKGKLTITGCTFDSIEYEAIQVTPMEGAEVNVSSNVFKAKADGTQVRHIHIEMAYGSGFDCEGQNIKLTVTDNQLHGTVSGDASMGIWWVGTDSTLKVDGNYMEHPETVSITLSNSGVHYNRGDLIYPARSQADADVDDLIPAVIVADKASGESKINAYNTLAEAVAAAQDGQTVRLLADVEQNAQLAINKSITLDLNGKTIKISGYTAEKAQVSVKGNLTIQNSSEAQTGKICSDYTGTAGRVVSVENGGKLTIAGGTITTEGMSCLSGSAVYIASGAEVNMTGGAVKVDAKRGNVAMNVKGSTGVFTMSGGSVIAEAGDGTETYITAISGSSGSTIQISAGTVSGPQALFARSSATTITGGSFTGSITVKNGSISGGTFDRALDKKACAAGYVPADNGDGTYGVEVGKFTVKVTSRTTGSDSPVANVAGGGSDITYAEGITVTASAISGYNFVGWFVNEYTGTPYSTDLTCKVKPTDDWTMIAVYEPISGGKFWLTVTASEFTVNGGAVQDSYLYEQFAIGASVTVNFTGSENFLYWVNASNKVVSTEKSYTFIMGSETTLKAVYGKARQNQATVVFISHSDQIISSKAYTTNDTIQFPVPPIKMGCTFTGWSMTEADIRAAMANNSGIIQVRALYTEPSIACKVTVVYPEGTDNQVVNAVVGKAIDVTAKDIEGKTFSYWTDNAGNILGYTKTLKLAPSGDMTVKAVYDQAAEAKPVITMSEVSATTANESYVVTFMATRAVPNGYKVVKQGILWSRDAVCGEDGAAAYMQFDSNGKLPDGVRAYIGNNLDLNGVTRYDIITKYNDRTFYGRGYMVLESDAGKLLYIYTDTIASGSYDSLTK